MYIIVYTVCPICPAPRCTWVLMLACRSPSGIHFGQWNQSAPPSAFHYYTRLGIVWGIQQYCCNITPKELQPWRLYLPTRRGFIQFGYWHARLYLLAVASGITFLYSLSPEIHFHTSSNISQRSISDSLHHDWEYPTPYSSPMHLSNHQQASSSSGVHLNAVTFSAAPI